MCVALEYSKSFWHAPDTLSPRTARCLIQKVHSDTVGIHSNLFAKPAPEEFTDRPAQNFAGQVPQGDIDTTHSGNVSHIVVHHRTHLLKMNLYLKRIFSK